MENKPNSNIQSMVFWPGFIVVVLFVGAGVFATESLGKFLSSALDFMSRNFGAGFMLFVIASIFVLLTIAFSKYGKITIGGKDAKPEISMWTWISICLCSSIGTGILFWGLGEPIFHYAGPPEATGIKAFSPDAAIFSISQAAFHWTVAQYTLYTLGAIAIAITAYNSDRFSMANTLEGLLGKEKAHGNIGNVVNTFAVFAIVGAVGCSTAVAILQAGGGLNTLLGMPENLFTRFIIAAVITGIFVTSCVTGMKKGLKIISDLNAKIFFALLIFIFIAGPTVFLADTSIMVLGDFISTFWEKATITNSFTTDEWAKGWTVQYWASFIVVAPLIGMFFARLGKGRSIRQFIIVSLIVPSAFSFIWISMWGGMAIYLQSEGIIDIWKQIQDNGMQHAVFSILQSFPLANVLIVVFLLALIASIVTYADPMSAVVASMTSKATNIQDEAPKLLKFFWGISIGTTGYILIASGGLDSVKGMFTIIGFPIMIIMCFMYVSTFKSLKKEYDKQGISKCDGSNSN